MKEQIENAFPHCIDKECLMTSKQTKFAIFDCEERKRCFIQTRKKREPAHFHVENPRKKLIHVFAVDHCLYTESDRFKKCDCVLFDKQCFCFVELKEAKIGRRSGQKQKALPQLANTIRMFQEKLDFADYTLEAYLSVGNLKRRFPRRTASSAKNVLQFEKEFGVALFEGNTKRFM